MSFVQFRPAPPLRDSIATIWDWRVEPGEFRLERILPSPGAGLIVNLFEDETRVYADDATRRCERTEGCALNGQALRSFLIDTREQIAVMGVIFRPGGAAHFLREPMQRLADTHASLSALGLTGVGALRERLLNTLDATARIALLEGWLRERYRPDAVHPAIAWALRTLEASPCIARVDGLVAASGYSARRFGELFQQQVGAGAKAYARLLRFRATIDAMERGRRIEWSRIAADCGFHDQPHLVREFRAFAGMTPGECALRRGPDVNHVALT